MPAAKTNVFNIPPSASFLRVLIDALLVGKLVPGFPAARDPLALSTATLYLPTRRACRLAREVFLDALGGEAAILPRIAAIGDVDEDEIAFADAATGDLAQTALELPPVIAPLERQLTLAQLIVKWAVTVKPEQGAPLVANTAAASISLANDLARLMDDMTTRQVPWDKLAKLVPDELDKYWQLSFAFLQFVHPQWRQILTETGAVESAVRRDLLIEAESKRLATGNAPVIVAGSTGSMPATARLLATVASLPHGAVVLPGLDTDLDDASWKRIAGDQDNGPAAGHPQFAMQALLARIGIARDAVKNLSGPQAHGRETLVSEAMRPATTTEHWQVRLADKSFRATTDKALASLTMIEAAHAEEEALAIAVVLREAVEIKGKSAALVTPDRALARRVVAALDRWHVVVDDSGGDALPDTKTGVFARLVADAALSGLAPVTLLALLKHSLFRLGAAPGEHNRAIATLEHAVLRGPRPRPGSAALRDALATFRASKNTLHRSDPRRHISDADLDAAATLVDKMSDALKPLETLAGKDLTFAAFANRHSGTVKALTIDDQEKADLLTGPDGSALALALDDIAVSPTAAGLVVAASDYAELFHATIATHVVRRPESPDVRVHIFGTLEARLQSIDRLVLGGLNEGSWPPETRSDPWLSRPMRRELGLNLPELRIGLSAHDFAQALGAKEVMLTRASKVGGAPAVASRFIQRLAAIAGKERWASAVKRGHDYLDDARSLDHPTVVTPTRRPEPKPPLAARPMQLSVTAIEDWLRDPYTIYARTILKLHPLNDIDTPPGGRDRGTIIHGAIGEFTEKFAAALPADPVKELLALGEKHFAPLKDYPEARAFWWPRFERIAHWFAGWEAERRTNVKALHAEIHGKIPFKVGEREFILTAIADRIERRADGSYAILDYKTGAARTEKQVRTGLAPQLTLEAAILRGGGFKDIPAGSVGEINYVTLKGGEPPGVPNPINFKDGTPDSHADNALARLKGLVARFENVEQAYFSLVHPMWTNHYGDYDHLARVKEWSATGGEGDDE
jgi:ATP-dependent helicase/nuclease subunit B